MPRDIFDLVAEQDADVFDDLETEDSAVDNLKGQVSKILEQFDAKDRKNENRKLSEEMKDFIREEISKIKPKQNVIERQVEQVIKHVQVPVHLEPKIIEKTAPPQIIKEVRVEVPAKDNRKLVEQSAVDELKKEIAALRKELAETRKLADNPIVVHGGPGVIGIPAPEPNPEGYVLTVNSEKKAQWKAATGGGTDISGYTINDATTLKNLASDASLDEIRQVLGTLITELQA